MKYIGYFTVIVITMFASALWSGYVLSTLWAWFIVPAFGVPGLSIAYAIGLALIVSYTTDHSFKKKQSYDESLSEQLCRAVGIAAIRPALALLCGWIVTLFI